jgi:hypothetical protein
LSRKRSRKPNLPDSTLRRFGATSTRASSSGDFNPDYSYVVQDLKRIGMLAAIFIAALLALSFILS